MFETKGVEIRRDIHFSEYQAIDRLNFSTAKYIKKCPRVMAASGSVEATAAMVLGTAVHTAILEPASFKRGYKPAPKGTRRGTKAWKEVAEMYPKAEIIRRNEYDEVVAMRDSVLSNGDAACLLKGEGCNELSIVWEDVSTGLELKARVDRCISDGDDAYVIDIKTTQNAAPYAMASRMVSDPFYYLLQMAWYQRAYYAAYGVLPKCVIIAVEKGPGNPVGVYDISEADMSMGQKELNELLVSISTAYKMGTLEQHYRRQVITLPNWYYTQQEDIMI